MILASLYHNDLRVNTIKVMITCVLRIHVKQPKNKNIFLNFMHLINQKVKTKNSNALITTKCFYF